MCEQRRGGAVADVVAAAAGVVVMDIPSEESEPEGRKGSHSKLGGGQRTKDSLTNCICSSIIITVIICWICLF